MKRNVPSARRRTPKPVVVMAATASDRPRVTLDTLKGGERVWSITVPGNSVSTATARAIQAARQLDSWRNELRSPKEQFTDVLERQLAAMPAKKATATGSRPG